MPVACEECVLRFICLDGDVCRFRICRYCGSKMETYGSSEYHGYVVCLNCGFSSVPKRRV